MEKIVVKVKDEKDVFAVLNGHGISYSYACKLLRNKDVRLNGQKIKENCEVFGGDEIVFFLSENVKSPIEILKSKIKYEDENIIIISKPAEIEVEGSGGLCEKFKALAVHRLDRNTTGLVILAKNKSSQECLVKAIKDRQIVKKYYAEVVGKAEFRNFRHDAFLVKDAKEALVKIYDKKVKGAVPISTIFNTIKSNISSSVVECELITGKTHQLRASLSYLGFPIIGDGKYGKNADNKKFKAKWQKLHSVSLSFKNLSSPLEYLNGKSFFDLPDWYKNKS